VPKYPYPDFRVHLLQCRPLSSWEAEGVQKIPTGISPQDILFTSDRLVPDGVVREM